MLRCSIPFHLKRDQAEYSMRFGDHDKIPVIISLLLIEKRVKLLP